MKQKWMASGKWQWARTIAYLWLFLGMLAMLVVSSFAWFSISTSPRVNDMGLFIHSPVGLQLATDYSAPDELWGQNINFPDLVSNASPLKPVTWSEEDQCFKAIRYGGDGRQSNRLKKLNDQDNANRAGDDQYYTMGVFYARTDSKCTVSLADAVEMSEGQHGAGTYVIGTPVWNAGLEAHEDAGRGAQYAVRIGFQIARIDPNTGLTVGEPVFVIYEPNADSHLDQTVRVLDTPSSDGTETLVSRERLVVQSTSSWSEAEPAQRDVTVKTLGTFLTDTDLFVIDEGEIVRIAMYIWVEGQDADCYGLPENASLFANIQFKADYDTQSGIEDIPQDEDEMEAETETENETEHEEQSEHEN